MDEEDDDAVMVESFESKKLNPLEAQEADIREHELKRAAMSRFATDKPTPTGYR
jgi:hypothetical protein